MVSEDKTTLYKQLHKLTALQSEQELENFLNLLWKTRKTGLSASDKSSVHLSLLKVPSLGDLDLVLACVRSLIRKCVHENLEGDGILKLLPHNLPLELQRMLLMSLQKYQSQWKQELSEEQGILPQLKSMAWTVDNKNKMPANRVAIITLKLQDFSKSPPTEIEVKFQLSRDTLDAMLRSMTYISEKLSSSVESASVPSQKRQRH
ncbi:protein FAR1-RELATED SEQUENCE 3-like isoform X2 [Olea europaea var. sylvestris]|uniref:protein FAR1-RELATED SEQUENCE 3-like isoform X2 n=1 Tax=Olea europaea var. sylvestris TaxID=158386 RepID=UPI000C1D500E|nr:protein FAR1-RELATED SEQUENCE 3-like isoform X2 [Olea europaea var. sylvestris]